MKCRHCSEDLRLVFVDLGSAPPSNAYLNKQTINKPEKYYPLKVLVCQKCWLVQTEDFAEADEFFDNEYAYFSSFSTTWLSHAKNYVNKMVELLKLNEKSHVVEVASNDGYLLQYVNDLGIKCTGIEPTKSTAQAAREKGIESIEKFFGVKLAKELIALGKAADLTTANNVLAHVPDINDFVSGFSILLKPDGVSTFEFPHIMELVKYNQFDTIYHEHFSYLSFSSVKSIFESNGLIVFDVEQLTTHGGSLRVYAQRLDSGKRVINERVNMMLKLEETAGINTEAYYLGFQIKAKKVKDDLLNFLLDASSRGKKIAAYGAAAKGNTLLNYAGIRSDLISFVVDRNPAKQNKMMPGSRIPIVDEEFLKKEKPDYIVLLPWNLKDEIIVQLDYVNSWKAKFIKAVPNLEII